jgi:hypothetical protein
MRRRRGKTDSKETQNTPSWLEGETQRNNLRSRRKDKSGSQLIQQHRAEHGPERRRRRVRRPKGSDGADQARSTRRTTEGQRISKEGVDGGAEHRTTEATFTFTLQEIKDSIPDTMLRDLARGKFDPSDMVRITKKRVEVSALAEDALLGPIKFARAPTRKARRRMPKPSERYIKEVEEHKNIHTDATAKVVLGTYFHLYKKFYGEEDPDYAGTSTQSAIILVDNMAQELTDGDFSKILAFVRRIMPLWWKRLKEGQDFPNSRPTIQSLFGGKRHFWANRKIYYKRWQNR